jgi:hypothetical protein
LIKKPHAAKKTSGLKILRVVKDYSQLNTTSEDEVYDKPSLKELIDIVGCNNKSFCPIELQQGYHDLPLKPSDFKKAIF